MATAIPRTLLTDFALVNPLYAGAKVWVYEVNLSTWQATTTLAPVYEAPLGGAKLGNPMTLDANGRFPVPPYVDRPVILRVGSASLPPHQTGIQGLQTAFRGEWAPGETYLPGQIVRDGLAGADTGNLYLAQAQHTASAYWLADLNHPDWVLYLPGSVGGQVASSRDYITPEDFGAIGDGNSRPIGVYLGLPVLADIQAYNGGIYAHVTNPTDELDWAAMQAAFSAGGIIKGKPDATYVLNQTLTCPNGLAQPNFDKCTLTWASMAAIADDHSNLIGPTNLALGIEGWINTELTPRNDLVFSPGKANFSDTSVAEQALGHGSSFGAVGKQITIPVGKWTVAVRLTLTDGATHGYFGPPYVLLRFTPYGIGFGAYEWPHPLTGAVAVPPEFDDWVSLDIEITDEPITTWVVVQGGNGDWEINGARISPFRMNYAIWSTGDVAGQASLYEETTWDGGILIGPSTYDEAEGTFSGAVGGVLHKTFGVDAARANFNNVHFRWFDKAVTFSDNAYLIAHNACTFGYSASCLYFTPGAKNAGENLRFNNCILFNSGLAIEAANGGEWNFINCSVDYCKRLLVAKREAMLNFVGHHWEHEPAETRLYLSAATGDYRGDTDHGTIITGVTSGATARVLIERLDPPYRPHFCVHVLSGTFVANESFTSDAGSGTLDGTVVWAPYQIELWGGSQMVMPSGEWLKAGYSHRGALHDVFLETASTGIYFGDVFGYNFSTASGDWATGWGRIKFGNHIAPGNVNWPSRMVLRNGAMDAFGGAGWIKGPGTADDMGFEGPEDGIGLMFAAHSYNGGNAPVNRGLIPWEQLVDAVTDVAHISGSGALRLQINPAFADGGTELRIYLPVTPGKIIFDEFWFSKPDAKPNIMHGPFTNGSPDPADIITIHLTAGSQFAVIEDVHIIDWLGGTPVGPGWGVTISGVTGNPGGVPDALFNTTHTIHDTEGGIEGGYRIDLGDGNEPTSSVVGGGAAISTTYEQIDIIVFCRRFWVSVIGQDAYGRPIIGQAAFQGEDHMRVKLAAHDWTLKANNWSYNTNYIPDADVAVPSGALARYGRGRAPAWATHWMMTWNWDRIRYTDALDPPPLYLADFYANVL